MDSATLDIVEERLNRLKLDMAQQASSIEALCNSCKHAGRCDGEPAEDCFEASAKTEPCPPPEHIEFEGDLTVLEAYAQIRRMLPKLPATTNGKSTFGRRVVLSGRFQTLDRVRAMRGTP